MAFRLSIVIGWWTFGLFPVLGLLWIMLLWTFVCKYLFKHPLLVLLGIYPGVEFAGSYGNSRSNFLRNHQTDFSATAPFCVSTSSAWGFQFSTYLCLFLKSLNSCKNCFSPLLVPSFASSLNSCLCSSGCLQAHGFSVHTVANEYGMLVKGLVSGLNPDSDAYHFWDRVHNFAFPSPNFLIWKLNNSFHFTRLRGFFSSSNQYLLIAQYMSGIIFLGDK